MTPRAQSYQDLQSELDRLFARVRQQANEVFNRAWDQGQRAGAIDAARLESIHWDKGEACEIGITVLVRVQRTGGDHGDN